MAIKIKRTFNDDTERKLEYPCMGIFGTGTIAIMTSDTEGTIIYSKFQSEIGRYCNTFLFEAWKPYYGSVFIEWED